MGEVSAGLLAGRTALVTGAASGIGRAIAEAMAGAGAAVMVVDLDPGGSEQVAASIRQAGGRSAAFTADITDPDAVLAMVEETVRRFGTVDVLVNNAGLQYVSPIEAFPLERWNRLINVMLTGPFLCTRAALPHMRMAGWGRIINMSSIHGKYASPYKAAYVAAKHGVIGLTRSIAVETATAGITANAICPGFVDTPLVRNQVPDLMRTHGVQTEEEALDIAVYSKTPQRRLLAPAEVAALAVYLASDAAKGVTGQAINLDGGMVMY